MNIRTIKFNIRIVVESDEGAFHAFCPDLKGLHVDGATEKEALENARDAAIAYLDSIIKHDDALPVGVLESDETVSVGDKFREFLARLLPSKKRHSYIEQLSVPA